MSLKHYRLILNHSKCYFAYLYPSFAPKRMIMGTTTATVYLNPTSKFQTLLPLLSSESRPQHRRFAGKLSQSASRCPGGADRWSSTGAQLRSPAHPHFAEHSIGPGRFSCRLSQRLTRGVRVQLGHTGETPSSPTPSQLVSKRLQESCVCLCAFMIWTVAVSHQTHLL